MDTEVKDQVWHILKPTKKAEMPSSLFFVDTETKTKDLPNDTDAHSLLLGRACKWNRSGDKEGKNLKWITFYKPEEVWQWIDANINDRNRAYVLAHNWSFDERIIHGDIHLPKLGWKIKRAIRDGSRWIDIWRKENKTLMVIDTTNFFKHSVLKIGKEVGLPKMYENAMKCPREDLEEYCKRDVEIIWLVMKRLLEWLEKEDFGSFKPTVASLSFSIFKHSYLRHRILIHKHKEVTDLEIESYKGGWTECFYIGQVKDKNIYALDVISMYASVMISNAFPTRLKGYTNKSSVPHLKRLMEKYLVIAKVKVDIDERAVGKKGDRLLFPVGRFEATLTTPELKEVLKVGVIEEVEEVAWYEGAKIFRDFIRAMSAKRMRAKQVGDEVLSTFYKLIQNSLYGKWGQRIVENVEEEGVEATEDIMYIKMKDPETGEKYNAYNFGGKMWKPIRKSVSFDSNISIASFVTAYSRCKMLGLWKKAGDGCAFYMDTDSLFVNDEGLENLKDEIGENELGKLEVEEVNSFDVRNVKHYYKNGKPVIKGVGKNAIQLKRNVFKEKRFEGYRMSLIRGTAREVRTEWIIKQLSEEYHKGEVGEDGKVKPKVLCEF